MKEMEKDVDGILEISSPSEIVSPESPRPQPPPLPRKRGKKRKPKNALYEPLGEKAIEGKDPNSVRHLIHANEILQDIMKLKNIMFFSEKPNENTFGMNSYYEIIKEPIWLLKIKTKLDEGLYSGLSEFLKDIRLCLENCYKFWGVDHRLSRKGLIIEQKLEQRLKELPVELLKEIDEYVVPDVAEEVPKELDSPVNGDDELKDENDEQNEDFKTDDDTMDSDFGQDLKDSDYNEDADLDDYDEDSNSVPDLSFIPYKPPDFKSKIMEKMMESKNDEENEEEDEEEARKMLSWEREMVPEDVELEIRKMPELAEIGHFLKLTHEVLNVEEISQFEVERMLLMPRESTTLQTLMTSMLTPELRRRALDGSPLMPYEIWTYELKKKIDRWFSFYYHEGDRSKAMEITGIGPYFWDVIQHLYPLTTKSFHEDFSFYQRVHVMKALCENILHTNKTIQDIFLEDTDLSKSRCNFYGKDKEGNRYFSLPFSPEIRVYRESKCLSKLLGNWKTPEGYFNKLQKFSMEFRWNEEENVPFFGPSTEFLMLVMDRDGLIALIDDLQNKEEFDLSDKLEDYLKDLSETKNEGLKSLYHQWKKFQERSPEYFAEITNLWMSLQKPVQSEMKAKTEFEKLGSDELVLGKRRKASIRYLDMDYSDSDEEPKRNPKKRKKKKKQENKDQENETPVISSEVVDEPIVIEEPVAAPLIRCVPFEKMRNDENVKETEIVVTDVKSVKMNNNVKVSDVITISSSDEENDVEVTGSTGAVRTIVVGSGQKPISQQLNSSIRQIGSVSIERVAPRPQAVIAQRAVMPRVPQTPRMSQRMVSPRMPLPRMTSRMPSPRMVSPRTPMSSPRTPISSPRRGQPRSMTPRQLFPSPRRPVPAPISSPPDSIIGTLTAATQPDGSIKIRVTLEDGGIINLTNLQLEEIRRQHGGFLPQKVKIPLSR